MTTHETINSLPVHHTTTQALYDLWGNGPAEWGWAGFAEDEEPSDRPLRVVDDREQYDDEWDGTFSLEVEDDFGGWQGVARVPAREFDGLT